MMYEYQINKNTKGEKFINSVTKRADDAWKLISNSKIYNKASDIIKVLSKKGDDLNKLIAKTVDNVKVSFGKWWEKQLQMGIIHPDIADWINRGLKDELEEEIGEELVEEAIENKVEKVIKEEVVEKVTQKAFKEIDLKAINKVADEGDILKVQLKDGTEITYKKADLSAEELKKLEDSKLIEGAGNTSESGSGTRFKYKHNPSYTPQVLRDAIEGPNAVYGYRPREDGSLASFTNGKWDDPITVEGYRQDRIAYHNRNEGTAQQIVSNMTAEGASPEDIARAEKNSYENLIKRGKTPEQIIKSATKENPAMDACTGLYDEYFD